MLLLAATALLIGLTAPELARDPPVGHDQNAIAQIENFRNLGRNEQDRLAGVGKIEQHFAPTSTPRVGSSRKSTLLSVPISFEIETFCWLPPDRLPAGLAGLSVLMDRLSTYCRARPRSFPAL